MNIRHYPKGIELLQDRIKEIDYFDFKLDVWKNRALINIESIFGSASCQWFEFSQLTTNLDNNQDDSNTQIKAIFIQKLNEYLEQLKDYQQISDNLDQDYKKKYYDLLAKWNRLIDEYNKLYLDYQNLKNKMS